MHPTDYVECECTAIALDGGDSMKCYATDWTQFARVDDNGQVVPVVVKGEDNAVLLTRDSVLADIEQLISVIDGLPTHALDAPITHRDYKGLLGLIATILKL